MELPPKPVNISGKEKAPQRYYTDLGRGHDYLLRCNDCQKLVPFEVLVSKGCCPKCGNRRVKEIETLTPWEWLKVRLGIINFADRKKFLAEFRHEF